MSEQPGYSDSGPQWTSPSGGGSSHSQPSPAYSEVPAGYGPAPAGPYGPTPAGPYGPTPAPAGPYGTSPTPYGPVGYPPTAYGQPPAPPPRPGTMRIDPVPGTEFGVAYATVPPTVSGVAIGSLIAGAGSIAVALVVGCFGLAGGAAGWGAIVAGAFAVLAGLLGLAGPGLAAIAMRQIRNSRGRITGRGWAIAGVVCGGVGLLLTAGGMGLSVLTMAA